MVFQQFNLVKRSSVLTNVLTGRLGYVNTYSSVLHLFSATDLNKALASLDQLDWLIKLMCVLTPFQVATQRVGIAAP